MTTITTVATATDTTTHATTHVFCHPLAPRETFLELDAAIERCYERVMDQLDAGLMSDELDQSRYDQMSQQLKEWTIKREAAINILRETMTYLHGTTELHDEATA